MQGRVKQVARAEAVGSLLRPDRLLVARGATGEEPAPPAELRAAEDAAVLDAIALQEAVGLDVITDGEMRRGSWCETPEILGCFERRPGERVWPASASKASFSSYPTVVRRVVGDEHKDVPGDVYGFLADHSHSRTKYTLAAPSYHRRHWSDEHSRPAYSRCEEYLQDIRDWTRGLVERLVARGCDYIQLDAPNYGTLCDPENRAYLEARGHDLAAETAFDASLDSSVFEGLEGVTRALHVCRGNMPGGAFHSSGGYANIAEELFPRLDLDVVLLEYDSDRTGDFAPLAHVRQGTTAVLGLLTTKSPELETEGDVEDRIAEAARVKDLGELALSTQCGFASVPGDNPVGPDQQRSKLELVSRVAHRVWA